jgi:hypothetical protein
VSSLKPDFLAMLQTLSEQEGQSKGGLGPKSEIFGRCESRARYDPGRPISHKSRLASGTVARTNQSHILGSPAKASSPSSAYQG